MMEFMTLVVAIGLGTVLGTVVLSALYMTLLSSKFGAKLITKWTKKYMINVMEEMEDLEL